MTTLWAAVEPLGIEALRRGELARHLTMPCRDSSSTNAWTKDGSLPRSRARMRWRTSANPSTKERILRHKAASAS